jgi:hypothetical protein
MFSNYFADAADKMPVWGKTSPSENFLKSRSDLIKVGY